MFARSRAGLALATALSLSACSASSVTTPSAQPSPTPAPSAASQPATFTVSGTLTATNGGEPLPGALVSALGFSATTDVAGHYSLSLPLGAAAAVTAITISGDAVLPRKTYVRNSGSHTVNLDVIQLDSAFDLDAYRQLARSASNGSASTSIIRRWSVSPNIYIRTVDSTGRDVEPEVIALVAEWSQRAVELWSSGMLQVGTVETGVDPRPDTVGWIMVDFVRDATSNECGRSSIGRNPGRMTLNIDRCGCGSTKVSPGTVVHEFGHALGFDHVSDRSSIMYPQIPGGCPLPVLSPLERYHAAIAYRRPYGNTDPDNDPVTSAY